jgi:hypothetical protein
VWDKNTRRDGGSLGITHSIPALAQLMMQAGLFVAADAYTASVTSGILTHYRREG